MSASAPASHHPDYRSSSAVGHRCRQMRLSGCARRSPSTFCQPVRQRRRTVTRPDSVLALEARRVAWLRLWRKLLADPPIPDDIKAEPEPRKPDCPEDDEAAEDSAAA